MSNIDFEFKKWTQLFGNIFARGGGAVLEILFVLLVADRLGVPGSASFFVAYSIIIVFSTFARGGEDIRIVRDIPKYTEQGDYLSIEGAIFNAFKTVFIYSVTLSSVVFLLAKYGVFVILIGQEANDLFLDLILAITPVAFIYLSAEVFRGYQKIIFSQFVYGWSVLFPTLLIVAFRDDLGAGEIASLFVKSSLLTALILVLLVVKQNKFFSNRQKYQRHTLNIIDSFFLIKVTVLISAWLPVWLFNFYGSEELVGMFIIANRFAMGTTLALVAVEASAGPRFASLYEAGNMSYLKAYLNKTQITSVSISLFLGVAILIISPFVAEFFAMGPNALFIPVTGVLIIGYITNAYFAPIGTYLMMTNCEKFALQIYLMGLVVYVPLLILLVKSSQALGIALACVLMYSLRGFLLSRYYNKIKTS